MMRLSYLIPRLIILSLFVLAVWAGSDPLIQRAVIKNMENAIGAKVEIAQLRTSSNKQKLFVKQLAIADPRDPLKNMIQADMVYLELDPQSLLERRIVIENSQTSQVVFNAPRTKPGSLDGSSSSHSDQPSWQPKSFEPIETLGRRWLDQLPISNELPAEQNHFSLLVTAKTYNDFWTKELASQKQSISALRSRTKKLKSVAENNLQNPLRPNKLDSGSVFTEVTAKSQLLSKNLIELENALLKHRTALKAAYKNDLSKLSQPRDSASFDGEAVTKLLLTKAEEKNINEIVEWFHWFRSALPDPHSDFRPSSERGENIVFQRANLKPKFLIKTINLAGEGRFANRHASFAGSANHLTSQPELHDQPASFELRAQGGEHHIILTCVLDRRGDSWKDTLKITCPDLEIDGQQLGERNSMLVTLGPQSRIQAEVDLQAIDDQLSGNVIFRHSNVSLHVDQLNDLAGGSTAALRMNQAIGNLKHFETRVEIGGTVDDYTYKLESDLGEQFAKLANGALSDDNENTERKRKLALKQVYDRQIEKLEKEVIPQIRELAQLLEDEVYEIANIKDIIPSSNSRLPRIR